MANFEMEPIFCKALKLLHSSSKDSADEIMHLLEEVLEQKYGGTKTLNLKSGTLLEEPSKAAEAPKPAKPSRGPSPVQGTTAGQASEKSSRDSSPPSEPVSSRTSPDVDDGDLALEIFEDDLNCKICKGMSVGPRNRLVECSDCHMLYHQECHKPPILENVNDPRLVWYCSSCTKKTQEKVQPKMKAVSAEQPVLKKPKTESTSEIKNPLFKRNEKSSNNSGHSKNSSGNGMAHLAASLQASKSSTSSLSSKQHSSSGSSNKSSPSLNYSKTPSSPNSKPQSGSAPAPANIIAADKRLQNMKKKAAAKMQEKRSKHK